LVKHDSIENKKIDRKQPMPVHSKLLSRSEECPHDPGVDENWQESFIISVWDTVREVYLFLRLSQMPNKDQGIAVFALSLWTPKFFYKNTQDSIPLRPGDRSEDSLIVAEGLCKYEYDGRFLWSVNDTNVDIQLTMSVAEGISVEQANSLLSISDVMTRMHRQAVGSVKGYVELQGERLDICGTAWRDHSWGPRKWLDFRVHRGFVAMFDNDLTAYFYSVILDSGEMNRNALVIRDGTAKIIEDCQGIVYMAEDGVSICGGHTSFVLENTEWMIEFQPIGNASISMLQDFACVNLLCKVSMGDRDGIGFCDISTRPQGGQKKPYLFPWSPAYIDNGLVVL
jgi:hypothetical protein